MYRVIRSKELLKINTPFLIDIREEAEVELGRIPGAINIPMNEMIDRPEKYLSKDKQYYLYCQSGIRTKKVCSLLSLLGYNVVEIEDGYEGWKILH